MVHIATQKADELLMDETKKQLSVHYSSADDNHFRGNQ